VIDKGPQPLLKFQLQFLADSLVNVKQAITALAYLLELLAGPHGVQQGAYVRILIFVQQ
jgi:hypothetical protein